MRFETEPGKAIEHLITNEPCLAADADHARDIKTRRSITCIKGFINGVKAIWIMQKQTCMASHSTDAEARAYYTAMQYIQYILENDLGIHGKKDDPTHYYL